MPISQLSTVRDAQAVAVYTGSSFSSLSRRSDVFARNVQRRLSPGRDTAELVSDYGELARPGSGWSRESALNLEGACIDIRITAGGSQHSIFRGIVTADNLQPAGTFTAPGGATIPTGQVVHRCRGIDWLLERIHPHQSVTEAYGEVKEMFAFNGRTTPPERNRSSVPVTDEYGTSHLFAWGAAAAQWTALDILTYLLRFASAQTDYTWALSGATAALDGVTPQIDQRGKNLRQLVNECVRPQDGLAVRYSVSGSTVTLSIVSLADSTIQDIDGNMAVPANTDTFSLSDAMDTGRDVSTPILTPVAESSYSRIEVLSEPIRVTAMLKRATVGLSDGLVSDWDPALETEFETADDKARSADRFRDVYAAWRLPDDWDGRDWEGSSVIPAYDPLTCTLDLLTPGSLAVPAMVFERTFPHGTGPSDQAPPLLQLWNGAEWIQPDRAAGDNVTPVGVQLLDDRPGLRMRTKSNVSLAGSGFAGSSDVSPAYDPVTDGFLVTVSFYTHTPLSCRMHASGTSGTKRVYVPGYHLWLCPGNAEWSPGQTIPAGTILRDDRAALKQLTARLSAWYGRTRNTLSFSASVAPGAVRIGRLVSSVYSGGSWTPVGTPVTSETWSWDDRGNFRYSMATDFADIDLMAISRRRVEQAEQELSRRIRRVEERLAATPVREPIGASGSPVAGGGLAWVRITGLHSDSPTTGQRVYSGTLYPDGPAGGSGGTVTVKIDGIAADVTEPSYGSWSDLPKMAATPFTETWTGASATHTDDTVHYIANPMLLI